MTKKIIKLYEYISQLNTYYDYGKLNFVSMLANGTLFVTTVKYLILCVC